MSWIPLVKNCYLGSNVVIPTFMAFLHVLFFLSLLRLKGWQSFLCFPLKITTHMNSQRLMSINDIWIKNVYYRFQMSFFLSLSRNYEKKTWHCVLCISLLFISNQQVSILKTPSQSVFFLWSLSWPKFLLPCCALPCVKSGASWVRTGPQFPAVFTS